MQLIDTHCHLDFEVFDHDRDQVIAAAVKKGVERFILPGVEVAQWRKLRKLCVENPRLFYGVGIHPWWLKDGDTSTFSLDVLSDFISDAKCVAVGECGLDKCVEVDFDLQLRVLEQHIACAIELQLPIIFHCVRAHNELLQLLKKVDFAKRGAGGVVHAFTGSLQTAEAYVRMGLKLAAGGAVTYERAVKTQQAFAQLPISAIVLETDSPDMPLVGRQGQRNSPEYLPEVAIALAELRNVREDELLPKLQKNACEIFSLNI